MALNEPAPHWAARTAIMVKKGLVLVLVLSALIAAGGMAAIWYGEYQAFGSSSFDATRWAWATQPRSDHAQFEIDMKCVRGAMVWDLQRNYLKAGMGIEDVKRLLGPSPKVNGTQCIDYDLGMCSGLKMDYDSLYVCFDENWKLAASYTVQH